MRPITSCNQHITTIYKSEPLLTCLCGAGVGCSAVDVQVIGNALVTVPRPDGEGLGCLGQHFQFFFAPLCGRLRIGSAHRKSIAKSDLSDRICIGSSSHWGRGRRAFDGHTCCTQSESVQFSQNGCFESGVVHGLKIVDSVRTLVHTKALKAEYWPNLARMSDDVKVLRRTFIFSRSKEYSASSSTR